MSREAFQRANTLLDSIAAENGKSEQAFRELGQAIYAKELEIIGVSVALKMKRPDQCNPDMRTFLLAYLNLAEVLLNPEMDIENLQSFVLKLEQTAKGIPFAIQYHQSITARLAWLNETVDFFNQYKEISKKAEDLAKKSGKDSRVAADAAITLCEGLQGAKNAFLKAVIIPVEDLKSKQNFVDTCKQLIDDAAEGPLVEYCGWKDILARFCNLVMRALGQGDKRAEAIAAGTYNFFRPQTDAGSLLDGFNSKLTTASPAA